MTYHSIFLGLGVHVHTMHRNKRTIIAVWNVIFFFNEKIIKSGRYNDYDLSPAYIYIHLNIYKRNKQATFLSYTFRTGVDMSPSSTDT